MRVWVVEYVNAYRDLYSTAEKAYEAIKTYIEGTYDREYDAEERVRYLTELDEEYKDYPEGFGVEDVAWAKAEEVY